MTGPGVADEGADPRLAEAHLEDPQDPHDEDQAEPAERHDHGVDGPLALHQAPVQDGQAGQAHQADRGSRPSAARRYPRRSANSDREPLLSASLGSTGRRCRSRTVHVSHGRVSDTFPGCYAADNGSRSRIIQGYVRVSAVLSRDRGGRLVPRSRGTCIDRGAAGPRGPCGWAVPLAGRRRLDRGSRDCARGLARRGRGSGLPARPPGVGGRDQLDLVALPVLQVGGVVVVSPGERVAVRVEQPPAVIRRVQDELVQFLAGCDMEGEMVQPRLSSGRADRRPGPVTAR